MRDPQLCEDIVSVSPTKCLEHACGHVWCGDCVKWAFNSSYTNNWNIEEFPAKSCCNDTPLGEAETLEHLHDLDTEFLLDCLERHWDWSKRPKPDPKESAELAAAIKDCQTCPECHNVIERRDGCNEMT